VVNDALMAIFFLVVGLEVKRELAVGELSSRGAALLPLFAAVGGMVAPAVLFLAVTAGSGDGRGWGIPMATDVAFALAALTALGSRVPSSLTAFLLGVAVIDDIGAILVIAVYYTDGVALGWLAGALATLAAVVVVRRLGLRHPLPFIALGLVVWLCTFESGVHATIAGVAMGLVTPVRPRTPGTPSALERTVELLHPWSGYVVLPLFALANAGIVLDHASLDAATQTPVALAAALGLVVGKVVGLSGGVALAVRLGVSDMPTGARPAHVVGVGALAGIGFTVSLFITALAYDDPALVAAAKIGVLGGSVVAACLGAALLVAAARRRPVSP
jgi:NhaA family Na+:H+ antiporter